MESALGERVREKGRAGGIGAALHRRALTARSTNADGHLLSILVIAQ